MKIKDLIQQLSTRDIESHLNIQRDFFYSEKKQALVIDSVLNDIPLPAFYFWIDNDKKYVLDGQQRIRSIENFYNKNILWKNKTYNELEENQRKKFDNTELKIIESSGTESYKRQIFYRINTLGVPLSEFEIVKGLYAGTYLSELSQYIKANPNVKNIFGTNNRGAVEYTILKLFYKRLSKLKKDQIYDFVEKRQNSSFNNDSKEINPYINFVYEIFGKKPKNLEIVFKISFNFIKEQRIWYNKKTEIQQKILNYNKSNDIKVDKNKYITYLDIIESVIENVKTDPQRFFTDSQKQKIFERDGDLCKEKKCKQKFDYYQLEVDHIKPWSRGGRTIIKNGQLLCRTHNRQKSNKYIDISS